MNILENSEFAVERAVIDDAIRFEGGRIELCDGRGVCVNVGEWRKCVFLSLDDFVKYCKERNISHNVCILGAPADTPELLNVDAPACKTFAYLEALPPALGALSVKKLAPTLAQTVAQSYDNRGHKMTAAEAEQAMRNKGVFGALVDSKLAGFIGRHVDGSMGMLTVFDAYRRRGVGEGLEAFMINYVMTFGRVPFCDVYTDNEPSLRLQKKLGLKESARYTFWIDELF